LILSWFLGVHAETRYLVLSVPKDRKIGYYKLPSTIFRVLVEGGDGGPANPKAITVDQENWRLFIADVPTQKIYWYQLIVLPDGKLVTDGRQHVAVESVEAKWLTVDGVGNLYFSGKLIVPPPMTTSEGIYKHDTIALATGVTINPKEVWTKANTGQNPRVYSPNGLATDNFHLFWANGGNGKTFGSLVKGPVEPPAVQPDLAVKPVADNTEAVEGVVITPTNVYYSTSDAGTTPIGIYGIPKNKAGAACADGGCVMISDQLSAPMGMAWDGDGTVYVAEYDTNKGGIWSFPSNGPLQKHQLSHFASMNGVFGLELIEVASDTVGHSIKVVYAVVLSLLTGYFL